jgi:hypothetical protein
MMYAMRTFKTAKPLLLALALAAPLAARAAPPASVQQEVQYLLSYIGNSSCEFYRNGTWSDAKTAQTHVRTKYDWALGKIATTRDFIELAATKSSFTGQAYQVRCGQAPPLASNAWLNEELARYQARARR